MFDVRSNEPELMDDPAFDEKSASQCYHYMSLVNAWAGGTRVVRRFIESMAMERQGLPLRILDIGSGICDIPIAVCRRARRRGLRLQYTCVEPSTYAVRLARERLAREGMTEVRLVQEDIFKHHPAEPYDCATASMCFHHFTDRQIMALLRTLRQYVLDGVLINDLRRSAAASLAAGLVSLPLSSAARHDGLLSIRRGFKARELKELLEQVGDCTVSVENAPVFRIAAVVRFGRHDETRR